MAMKLRKEIRLDGFTQDLLNDLKTSGKYGSEGSIIRLAIQEFARMQKNNAQTRISTEIPDTPIRLFDIIGSNDKGIPSMR